MTQFKSMLSFSRRTIYSVVGTFVTLMDVSQSQSKDDKNSAKRVSVGRKSGILYSISYPHFPVINV